MYHRIATGFVLVLLLMGCLSAAGQGGRGQGGGKPSAVAAAEDWLELVDHEKYTQSWEQASKLFKSVVDQKDWVLSLKAVREPLGSVISRQLIKAERANELPGAPPGKYMVMHFRTAYANKPSSIETVTVSSESDGMWRISGYFIR